MPNFRVTFGMGSTRHITIVDVPTADAALFAVGNSWPGYARKVEPIGPTPSQILAGAVDAWRHKMTGELRTEQQTQQDRVELENWFFLTFMPDAMRALERPEDLATLKQLGLLND